LPGATFTSFDIVFSPALPPVLRQWILQGRQTNQRFNVLFFRP